MITKDIRNINFHCKHFAIMILRVQLLSLILLSIANRHICSKLLVLASCLQLDNQHLSTFLPYLLLLLNKLLFSTLFLQLFICLSAVSK